MAEAATLPDTDIRSLRFVLRDATRADHERVDRLAERFQITTEAGYRAFLGWQARLLPGLEAMFVAAGDLPDWAERRRTAALAADLAALGVAMPAPASLPGFESDAERYGALYVLEGSRLGGAVLARQVAAALPDAPCAFLRHGEGTRLWPVFVQWLDSRRLSEGGVEAMIRGARATFAAYADAARAEAA